MTSGNPWQRYGIYALAGLLWAGGVGVALNRLWRYEDVAGAPGQAPARWPSASRLPRHPGTMTIVMAVHPHCPCTRAALTELDLLLTSLQRRPVEAYALFIRPLEFKAGWEKTDLWSQAAAIPRVHPIRDDGGAESALFGAFTSGQTMLYDEDGRLLFSGGITAARGHAGDNVGLHALYDWAARRMAGRRETPVFGCPLHSRARQDPPAS